MTPWIWLIATLSGIVLWVLTRRRLRSPGGGALACVALVLAGVLGEWALHGWRGGALPRLTREEFDRLVPAEVPDNGYVGSQACRECHVRQHATWSASYHRTITRKPSEEAIIPPFDGQEIQVGGRRFTLSRRADEFWMRFQEPDEIRLSPGGQVSPVERPVGLVTGSHYQQILWYPTGIPRALGQLPIYYLLESREWVPATATLLTPPSLEPHSGTGEWNANCYRCHATQGRPRPTADGEIDTLVAEFGVSCEACHGPGEQHATLRRGLPAGKTLALTEDPIVNPRRLDHRQSSAVCGVCHSYNVPRTADQGKREKQVGMLFRPGDEFHKTLRLIRPTEDNLLDIRRADSDPDEYFSHRFWRDGMVRTGGHEYNGLSEASCFRKGELSCLTCHDMHQRETDSRAPADWANRQLSPTGSTDASCLSCHATEQYAAERHTHHVAESSGARCINCHMPHTDYGLLHAQRSHQISSPRTETELQTGRPNACNLCHLNQTLGWTADHLRDWYGQSRPALEPVQEDIASGVRLALTGDAGQRVLIAWSLGWQPAREVSGVDWMPPMFAQLLLDPYDAVRYVARRSLLSDPDFSDLEIPFGGSADQRSAAAKRVLSRWREHPPRESPGRQGVLLDDRGKFLDPEMSRLLRIRDKKPVELAE